MPQIHTIKPEYDPARLFRAFAAETPPVSPAWWPNDKQRVIVFQQPDLASVHARMAAIRPHDPLCFDKVGHPHDNECECWCHEGGDS